MNVLVTGGAGFIGTNLCRRLVADRMEVVALDDLSTGRRENLTGLPITFVEGNILDRRLLERLAFDSSAIVHLAALPSVPRSLEDPVSSHVVNTDGTVAVLEAARAAGNVHVVVASSSSVYGASPELPKHEDQPTRPVSPYAASKLAAESYALAYQCSFGLPVLALRFFNVFGPYQAANHAYAAVIPALVSAALATRPLPIHGDGHQSRDFTYVDTVTAVIADAVQRGVSHPDPVNLAFGTRTELLDIVDLLAEILGAQLAVEHLEPRAGDVRHSQADSTRLRKLFPDIEATPLPDALEATVDWFRVEEGAAMPAGGLQRRP